MEKALESFEKGDWSGCFQACNSIKIIISSEMNKGEKNFFEKITQQLRDLVWASMGKDYSRDGKVRIEKDIALQKVPGLMETYLQLLFQEMSNQGIWFPKSNKHETFQDLILEETFGLEPEKATDKIKKLSESMTSKEILELLPR
ncbi:MAG TPA: hypothetical protein PLG47_05065, partial [Candidatus Dojkabacteria bacterium]|nr:hypothetical protein [Candidatus Dojkabacteria bacterium]